MLTSIFSPAIKLMNNLQYRSKFWLLGSAILLVILVLLFEVFSNLNRDIVTAEQEIAGLQMLKPLNRLTQSMQQHRGLSSGVLNGNQAMSEKRANKEKEVSEALATSEEALMPSLRTSESWQRIRNDWRSISSEGMSWPAADNLKRHTEMITKVLTFMIEVADDTSLTLDPVMNTYYFMDTIVTKMPSMLEPLGITRARGTGTLAARQLSPDMRLSLASLLAQMSRILSEQNSNLDKIMLHSPELELALRPASQAFSKGVEDIFALIRNDIFSERFDTAPQDYFNQTTQVIDMGYKVMFETLIPQFEQQLQLRKQEAQTTLLLDMALSFGVMLLVLYFAFGAYLSVLASVQDFSSGARRLAEGDLTADFACQGADELHSAARDFNSMAAAFRGLLGRIQRDVGMLNATAEALANSSQKISQSTSVQSDSAAGMAASVEEMTVGINHIAHSAEDAQRFSIDSDTVASQGVSIVESVVQEIQGIANTVNHSAGVVENLGNQSNQISEIVGTIKDIADQTNLLALNAAIEAARAGEAGRGFAVVADEVRKLAERTTKSTQEIADMIGAIQSGTANAVNSMKQGVELVSSGVDKAKQAGSTISQIQLHSRQVVESIKEISSALREQSTASNEIARSVEQIAQMAEGNNASANGNAASARNLRDLAETLSTEVGRFRT